MKPIHWRWYDSVTACGLNTNKLDNAFTTQLKVRTTCKNCIKVLLADGSKDYWMTRVLK